MSENTPTSPESADFGRSLWRMLGDGGTWGIPRSGLVYRKDQGNARLVLTARMPWEEGMPISEEQLREQQNADHQGIELMMSVVGVTVDDESR